MAKDTGKTVPGLLTEVVKKLEEVDKTQDTTDKSIKDESAKQQALLQVGLNMNADQVAAAEALTVASEKSVQIQDQVRDADLAKKGKDAENDRESGNIFSQMLGYLEGIFDNTIPKAENITFDGIGQAAGGFVAAIGGALLGLGVGIAAGLLGNVKLILGGFAKVLKLGFTKLGASLAKAFPKTANLLKGIRTSITASAKTFKNFFKDIPKAFKAGFAGLKTFRTSVGAFGKLGFFGKLGALLAKGVNALKSIGKFTGITKAFAAIKNAFAGFKGALGGLSKGSKLLDPIKKFLKPITSIFKTFFTAFKSFGRVIGKLFLPIQIIMGIVDTVKGAIKGFTEQEGGLGKKIMAGIFGGFSGLLQGLIGMPLDLLKDGIAWLMGKFGFDDSAEALKSFSFKDMIGKLFDKIKEAVFGIIDWFGTLFSNPMGALKSLVSGVGNMMKKFYGAILRLILPDPAGDGKWYNPMNLIQKAIPDSVYEFAGLDPETGARIPEPTDQIEGAGPQVMTGEQLDQTSTENQSIKEEYTKEIVVQQVNNQSNSTTTTTSFSNTRGSRKRRDLNLANQ